MATPLLNDYTDDKVVPPPLNLKKAESTPVPVKSNRALAPKPANGNMTMVIEDIDDEMAELSGRVKEVSVYASSFPTESPTPRGSGNITVDGTPVRATFIRTKTEMLNQGGSFNSRVTDLGADNKLIQTFEPKIEDYAEKTGYGQFRRRSTEKPKNFRKKMSTYKVRRLSQALIEELEEDKPNQNEFSPRNTNHGHNPLHIGGLLQRATGMKPRAKSGGRVTSVDAK